MGRPRKNKLPAGPYDENVGTSGLPENVLLQIDPALPKTSQVYAIMRSAIVNLHLAPGSIVNEKLICDQLGISRTPLREAILQLQGENLVSVVPNSGTYVSKIDLQSVFDGHLVRDALPRVEGDPQGGQEAEGPPPGGRPPPHGPAGVRAEDGVDLGRGEADLQGEEDEGGRVQVRD